MSAKFTGRAKEALERAAAEAARSNAGPISAEHLLLGILQDRDSLGSAVLKGFGVDLDLLGDELRTVTTLDGSVAADSSDFTPGAQRAVELAHEAALSFTPPHALIGTEHLLLGVIREGTSAAASALRSHGLDEPKALAEVLRVLESPVPFDQTMAKAEQLAKERHTNDLSSSASTCQVCNANPATLHLTRIKDDQVAELHLCERCGGDLGYGFF